MYKNINSQYLKSIKSTKGRFRTLWKLVKSIHKQYILYKRVLVTKIPQVLWVKQQLTCPGCTVNVTVTDKDTLLFLQSFDHKQLHNVSTATSQTNMPMDMDAEINTCVQAHTKTHDLPGWLFSHLSLCLYLNCRWSTVSRGHSTTFGCLTTDTHSVLWPTRFTVSKSLCFLPLEHIKLWIIALSLQVETALQCSGARYTATPLQNWQMDKDKILH